VRVSGRLAESGVGSRFRWSSRFIAFAAGHWSLGGNTIIRELQRNGVGSRFREPVLNIDHRCPKTTPEPYGNLTLTNSLRSLLNDLDRLADEQPEPGDESAVDSRLSTAWLQSATAEQISLLLEGLLDRSPPANAAVDRLLAAAFQQMMLRQHGQQPAAAVVSGRVGWWC
jgi:hypothetical protein